MKHIVVGIFAQVDAGKTTLSEIMLYRSGEIRKLGRVDHGNAFLDTHLQKPNAFGGATVSCRFLFGLILRFSQVLS